MPDINVKDNNSSFESLSSDDVTGTTSGAQSIEVKTSTNNSSTTPLPNMTGPSDPMLSGGPKPLTETNNSGASNSTNPSDTHADNLKTTQPDMKPKTFKPKTGTLNFLRVVVDVLLVAIIIILFLQDRTLSTDKNSLGNSVANLQQSANKVEEAQSSAALAVGKLIPSLVNQTPILIPLNSTNLTGQTAPLFSNATSGDDLLIYLKADQAVVYSPSSDKIIGQSTLQFISSSSTTSTSTTAPSASTK